MSANASQQRKNGIFSEETVLKAALGKRIMQLREARDWSQAELARRVGVERTTLLRWERGATPPLGKLLALSQVLETTLDALIAGRTADPAPESLTPEQRRAAAGHLNQIASLLGLRTGQPKRPTSPPS